MTAPTGSGVTDAAVSAMGSDTSDSSAGAAGSGGKGASDAATGVSGISGSVSDSGMADVIHFHMIGRLTQRIRVARQVLPDVKCMLR